MRKLMPTVLVVLISIFVALIIGEALVRLSSKYWLLNFDIEMWRYARTVKRVADDPGVVQDHAPNSTELLMGVELRTDEHGFRRPDPETEKNRKPNSRLVITLGDSVTLGWGVAASETLAAQLERRLPNSTVLNAGIGNSNTSMELARYKRDLCALKPDWLILGFFVNDAEPDPLPARSYLLNNSALAVLVYGATRARGASYLDYYQSLYRDGQPGWERCRQSLRELGALLRQDGVKATLLLIPDMHQPKNFGPFADTYRRVADEGRAAGFEVLDGSNSFPAGAGDKYFVTPTDAHPNAAAQTIFADTLTRSRFFASHGMSLTQ